RFKEKFAAKREMFTGLVEGQEPKVLWIGCSDSRVIPELISGTAPGDLFVVRNVANVVPPDGTSGDAVGAVIEYAVLHLHVSHAVVCGHTGCGGIKALEGHVNMSREPHIARWVELARPARTQVEASGVPEEARYLETIKANVLLQCKNLTSYRCVRDVVKAGQLKIHGWLYDLSSGDLLAYDEQSGGWGALPALE
ncbi:MAG: carbonic anhydrase, partial [bacterium]|nr:carbonic anhydrase [bacterium]